MRGKVSERRPCAAGCGGTYVVFPRRKTELCRACCARARVTSDAHRAAISKAMSRRWADPVEATHLRTKIRASANRPERIEQLRKAGLASGPDRARYVNTPAGSPARKLANKRMVDTKLAWCPIEYRPLYSFLRKKKEIPAPEAKRLVLEQVEADAAAYQRTGTLPQSERLETLS